MVKFTNKVKLRIVVATAVFLWLAYLGLVDSWDIKNNCFKQHTYALLELMAINKNAKWSEEERQGLPVFMWRVPAIEPAVYDPFLKQQGMKGYLVDISSGENAKPLAKDTAVELTGKLYVHRHGWIHRLFENSKTHLNLPILIAGKQYVVSWFLLSENVRNSIRESHCYEHSD